MGVDLRRSKSADLYTTMTCDEAENQRPLAGQKRPNRPAMAEFRPENKKAKIEVTLASSESGQLSQIESEFQILKSLIPDIANRQQINELEIIDACVTYIEALQTQLNVVHNDEEPTEDETEEDDE